MVAELTDRQRQALRVLLDEARSVHPARIARLIDGPGRSGAGWRSTLDALERKGLVRGNYQSYSGGRVFAILASGVEALGER